MLTLILKANNSCNLRCKYCSVGDKRESKMMSESEMTRALSWFADYSRERNEMNPAVIFHGGEPLLIPVMQYRKCIDELLSRNSDMNFRFNIRTNGTILTPEIISLMKDYDIKPGISIDGMKRIHDSQRRDINGKGTYDRIMASIRMLKAEGIHVSTLMVLTRESLNAPLDYLRDFADMNIPLKINPLYSAGEAEKHPELFLRSGEYADFMIRAFEYVIENDINISLMPVEYVLQAVIDDHTPRGCIFSERCHESFICVNQDGNIYPCGRYADDKANLLGNIHDGITESGHEMLKRLKVSRLRTECINCRYRKFCNGGCTVMNGMMCNDYKKFLDYLYADGLRKYKAYLLSRRDEIVSSLHAV